MPKDVGDLRRVRVCRFPRFRPLPCVESRQSRESFPTVAVCRFPPSRASNPPVPAPVLGPNHGILCIVSHCPDPSHRPKPCFNSHGLKQRSSPTKTGKPAPASSPLNNTFRGMAQEGQCRRACPPTCQHVDKSTNKPGGWPPIRLAGRPTCLLVCQLVGWPTG